MQLCRAMIDALLPPGPLWTPEEGGGLDTLLTGIGDCFEDVRDDLMQLARIRSPYNTPILPDLEKEYGVTPRTSAAGTTRRGYLDAVKRAGSGDGSLDFLQDTLQTAGFDVKVHANNPPVDPGFFLYYAPSAIFGNESALFGRAAMAARRGELLVNGDVYRTGQELMRYEIPTDPGYWPLFFFVGGDATRNADGELTLIDEAQVPAERRGELRTLILRCKPMHSWAGLCVAYT